MHITQRSKWDKIIEVVLSINMLRFYVLIRSLLNTVSRTFYVIKCMYCRMKMIKRRQKGEDEQDVLD